ncbi:PilW family protein [Aquipseudomonas guryensis]|uniref:PilW family protein n=1 Tax=Aquipseudomonas guryensis TaxID=2759165 RepID=A0A7W4DBG6_9GAMM|nr:PilW family protein [Pseudomonas guryensis]MBB1519527.1 PilW family protein [Pseudomonas guryensis]
MNSFTLAARPQSRGFGLIELLVAMAIGLLLMGATLKLYLDLNRSHQDMARVNQQIEAGGVAIQVLREDLLHAGFWNGYVPEFDDFTFSTAPTDYPTAAPGPCLAFSSWTATEKANRVGMAIQLFDDVPTGCTTQLPDRVADSDVLVVRYAQTCVPGTANCAALNAADAYFQASQCNSDAVRYSIELGGGTLTQRDCSTLAERRQWVNNIYYLRTYSTTPGDGIPTLMRSSFSAGVQQPAVALIEGVEAMRFELGVDQVSDAGLAVVSTDPVAWANTEVRTSPTNRGDGAADALCRSATPCTLADQINTVMVKAYLLVRTLNETQGYTSDKTYFVGDPGDSDAEFGPFSDGFKRHVYTTSVRLTNVSGRRETP